MKNGTRLSSAASLPDNCLSRRRYLRIVELQKPNRSLAMKLSKSVAELQREHVVLELECIDRMYLNAYVPQLTTEGGVAGFVRGYLGHRFASTKAVAQMSESFVESICSLGSITKSIWSGRCWLSQPGYRRVLPTFAPRFKCKCRDFVADDFAFNSEALERHTITSYDLKIRKTVIS
jgi:hypothetical protein